MGFLNGFPPLCISLMNIRDWKLVPFRKLLPLMVECMQINFWTNCIDVQRNMAPRIRITVFENQSESLLFISFSSTVKCDDVNNGVYDIWQWCCCLVVYFIFILLASQTGHSVGKFPLEFTKAPALHNLTTLDIHFQIFWHLLKIRVDRHWQI